MTTIITPSSLWQGNAVAGSRWTAEQLSVLRKRGRNPDTVATATIARMPRYNTENWLMPPIAQRIVLPCLRTSRAGRVLVITPAGAEQWMDPARG